MADDVLGQIPLFKALPTRERRELQDLLRPRKYTAHQPVVWLGEPGNDFYLVRQGNLSVTCPDESGNEVRLAMLTEGQFFGEISLLDGGPRTATVRAETDSELLSLGREDFLAFLRTHPDASIMMLTILGSRQRETLEKMRGIRNVNEAIAASANNWHRLAERVARYSASRAFVVFNIVLFSIWIILNVLITHLHPAHLEPFDEPPTFSVLGLIGTLEALFITLFVLISQGLQGERDRIRADLDYQVNLKAHQEVMQLHRKVDQLAEIVAGKKPSA